MPRRSTLPLHAHSKIRGAPASSRFVRLAVAILGCLLLGAFFFNIAFMQEVGEGEALETAAFAEMSEHARAESRHKPSSEADQEAIEAEAMREAIAAPLIGADGEDRSQPAPRAESGAGRRDDTRRDKADSAEISYLGPPPPPPATPSPPSPASKLPPPTSQHLSDSTPSADKQKMVEIGECGDDEFSEPLVTKAQFEEAWGGCWTDSGREVLVALPYSADMLCELQRVMFTRLKAMECANPGFNLRLGLYDKPYSNDMDAAKTKKSGRGVLATLRNALLDDYLAPAHELVLWLDADVVDYPADMVAQLHAANPGGVSAPLVLIEESDTEEFHKHLCKRPLCHMGMQRHTREIRQWSDRRYKQFYDRAAFIASNTNITTNKAFPGNSLPFPPYLGGVDGWMAALASGTVACESVGTVYMIPAEVYRSTSVATQVCPHP